MQARLPHLFRVFDFVSLTVVIGRAELGVQVSDPSAGSKLRQCR